MLAKQLYLIRGPDALLTFEKSRLKAPVPAPRSGDAIPLAALEQLVAEADARPQSPAIALAA